MANFNTNCTVLFDEPLSGHTTFRIGGPAEAYVIPRDASALATLVTAARDRDIRVTVLGGGANVLVSDSGVKGIVVSTAGLDAVHVSPDGIMMAGAGVPVVRLADTAREFGLSGLEFAAGLPGSVGGAVFMNARCYDREFADVLADVDALAPGPADTTRDGDPPLIRPTVLHPVTVQPEPGRWAYKMTPFMPGGRLEGAIITLARFRLVPGDREAISAAMSAHEDDRRAKGHFDYPSAGSLFKNNRAFGRPTGRILDELGFRGKRLGDAMVSPKHANIFVNAGNARAADVLELISQARKAAFDAFGFDLEPEVVMLGDF